MILDDKYSWDGLSHQADEHMRTKDVGLRNNIRHETHEAEI